jgi:hypothetical protein
MGRTSSKQALPEYCYNGKKLHASYIDALNWAESWKGILSMFSVITFLGQVNLGGKVDKKR